MQELVEHLTDTVHETVALTYEQMYAVTKGEVKYLVTGLLRY
jgi:hypothetical protein